MSERSRPKVLLMSCSKDGGIDFLVEGILGQGNNKPVSETSSYKEHNWTIKNKYYSADISLISTKTSQPNDVIKQFLDEIEAVIISFELGDECTFHNAKSLAKHFEDGDLDVKLLFAKEIERLSELDARREAVTEWCVENSFELVERYATDDNEEFPEKIGFERVQEALHTNMWPNMESAQESETSETCAGHQNSDGNPTEPEQTSANETKGAEGQDEKEKTSGGAESDLQNFEELFGKLHDMKLHAQSLSDEGRKEYAEQVTIAFWKAMGMNDEEITGL
eukprot:Seg3947.6 transcript_id=Seg3947.6/GoldUCD/mRNA.D3Y31 product="alpha- and gamma-adaptin-binding protein p34" protein_id=Seg3947.6/GoldUCD/D3Y31